MYSFHLRFYIRAFKLRHQQINTNIRCKENKLKNQNEFYEF